MKKCINRKSIICFALCLVMLMGASTTSLAASGTAYSYDNLKIEWLTTASRASATLKSGKSAYLEVYVSGDGYTGDKKEKSFSASNSVEYGASVSCGADWVGTTIKNGSADGIRNWSQGVSATIGY